MVGICAAPNANRVIDLITHQCIRTTAGDHSREGIGQVFRRIYNFRLQRNLMTYVLTVLDLAYFPCAEGHLNLQSMAQVYEMPDSNASDTRHEGL